jgi:hypothetical protein
MYSAHPVNYHQAMSMKGDHPEVNMERERPAASLQRIAPILFVIWCSIAAIYVSGALSRLTYVLGDHSFWLARELVPPERAQHVVIVALDDATVMAIDKPMGAAHDAFAMGLKRIAESKPLAIVFDVAMPSRSFESVSPGGAARLAQAISTINAAVPSAYAVAIDTNGHISLPAKILAQAMTEERMGVATWSLDRDQAVRRFEPISDRNGAPVPLLLEALAAQLKLPITKRPLNFHITSRWHASLRKMPIASQTPI